MDTALTAIGEVEAVAADGEHATAPGRPARDVRPPHVGEPEVVDVGVHGRHDQVAGEDRPVVPALVDPGVPAEVGAVERAPGPAERGAVEPPVRGAQVDGLGDLVLVRGHRPDHGPPASARVSAGAEAGGVATGWEAEVAAVLPVELRGAVIADLVADAGDVVELTVSPNQSQLLVSLEDIWFTTRLIDGTFPDLSQIIPKDWNTRTIVNREVLLDAARRAAIFSRSANDVVRFDIAPASESLDMGRVTVTGNAADTGDNRDDVDAQVEGGEMQIAFNGRYLTDVLSVMRDPNVAFELQGANAAGVIKPADSDDFTQVIMPMVIGAD